MSRECRPNLSAGQKRSRRLSAARKEYRPSRSELASYVQGMVLMYDFCREKRPDLVICPLRGAEPFKRAYEKIAEARGESGSLPDFVLPPVGTCIVEKAEWKIHPTGPGRIEGYFSIEPCLTERGLKPSEKNGILESELRNYFAANPEARTVVLADEVINGGTILRHDRNVRGVLAKSGTGAALHTVAIEYEKTDKSDKYLQAAEEKNFFRVPVENLFTSDENFFLPTIKRKSDGSFEKLEDGNLECVLEEIERTVLPDSPAKYL